MSCLTCTPLTLQYCLSLLTVLVTLLFCSPCLCLLAELPYLAALSHSCLPCLGSYLCSHEVVHQPVLLSPDWASAPGFLSSGVQVSSVSTSEPESSPQSLSHRPSECVRKLCPGSALERPSAHANIKQS